MSEAIEDKFLYTTTPALLTADAVKSSGWLRQGRGDKHSKIPPPPGCRGVLRENLAKLSVSRGSLVKTVT